ncbi:MAG: hypothetical protein JXA89_18205 [Anaerolineae bacterium]|nr:hypothetical protein [Anaerolineae bacterium]
MASYYVETKLDPEKAIEKAVAYFGKGGVGLETTDQSACCARFEGGGGHVAVTVSNGVKTRVDLETREWDYDVRQFMRRIA